MAVLSEEQTMLRDAAKSWAREKSPVTAFRKLRDSGNADGFDRVAWAEMCEMGWAGILVPEDHGGVDLGYQTLGLVLEETGRTLTASPLFSTALVATSALLLGGSAAQKAEWLPKFASGEALGALAVDEHAHHAPERIALEAKKSGSGYALTGKKVFVIDGGTADVLVVAARTSGQPGDKAGLTLFLVPADAKGVTRTSLHSVDSCGVANISFANVEVPGEAVLGAVGEGFAILEAVLDRARAGLAAEMLGAAEQSFEATLEYLKTRTQFGQLIGSFQALQHRAAKMYTDLEMTRSCVEAALTAIDKGAKDVPALCSLAKAKASELAHLVSNEMVQMHGGIGMTDAHDAGLYLKRARATEATFGGAAFHRDRYATLMGY
ncbi:MAG: acyl-CoA dehydrogenase family protein [Alphaproteobacteria bacterium]|nr:acyl-CoA dehydrogenase family protein [Alphaproteobacteria bacterium]